MSKFLSVFLLAALFQSTPNLTTHLSEQRQVEQALSAIYAQNTQPPRFDPRLDEAASQLAQKILDEPPDKPLQPFPSEVLQEAIWKAGAFDPAPSAIVLKASTPQSLGRAMATHPELRTRRATHFGLAILSSSTCVSGVLLLSNRRVKLDVLPSQARLGVPERLSGRFEAPLRSLRVALTDPQGNVHDTEVQEDGAGHFDLKLIFQKPGLNVLELLAKGRHGTEVIAIFPVEVAGTDTLLPEPRRKRPASTQARSMVPERQNMARAQEQVFEAVNVLRASHRQPPLVRDARLDALATHHARQMGTLGFFGHNSPEEGDVAKRLESAGIEYRVVAENLAESHSALDAQWLLESSPGHRKNLLLPEVTHIGIGTAPVPDRPGNLYLVQIFMTPKAL